VDRCDLHFAPLPAGATISVSVTAIPSVLGFVKFDASVSAPVDVDPSNNIAFYAVAVSP
jgi:hypothetical protein